MTTSTIDKLLQGILLDPDSAEMPNRARMLRKKLESSGVKAENATVGGGASRHDSDQDFVRRNRFFMERNKALEQANAELQEKIQKLYKDAQPVRRRFRFEKDDVLLAWQHTVDLALKTDLLTYLNGQKVGLWRRMSALDYFTANVWNLKSVSPETLASIFEVVAPNDPLPHDWIDQFLKPKAERIVKAPPPRQDWAKLRLEFTQAAAAEG